MDELDQKRVKLDNARNSLEEIVHECDRCLKQEWGAAVQHCVPVVRKLSCVLGDARHILLHDDTAEEEVRSAS